MKFIKVLQHDGIPFGVTRLYKILYSLVKPNGIPLYKFHMYLSLILTLRDLMMVKVLQHDGIPFGFTRLYKILYSLVKPNGIPLYKFHMYLSLILTLRDLMMVQ